jgi:hypothetical protein
MARRGVWCERCAGPKGLMERRVAWRGGRRVILMPAGRPWPCGGRAHVYYTVLRGSAEVGPPARRLVFGRSGVDPHSASTSSHSCSRSRHWHCNLHPENKSARSPTERASRATRETRREWRESRYCYWQIPYDSLRIFYVITFDANNRTYTHSANETSSLYVAYTRYACKAQ